jgi:hypothetical protein
LRVNQVFASDDGCHGGSIQQLTPDTSTR